MQHDGANWQEVVRFADLLLRAEQRRPDAEALVLDDRRLTYAELSARAIAAARCLAALGVGPRSHVGVLMANSVEFVELLFGISLLGGAIVPINTRLAPRELRHVVEDGDLEVIVTGAAVAEDVDYAARLAAALPGLESAPNPKQLTLEGLPRLRSVVLLGDERRPGLLAEDEFVAAGASVTRDHVLACHRKTPVRSVAMIMYTSGTTAVPKGCVMSHEALVRTSVVAGRTRFKLTESDRLWDPLPMFHMSSILPLIGVCDAGATFISTAHFDPDAAMETFDCERVTVSFATFPAITQALLHHPDYHVDRWRHIRLINNVAPPDTMRWMQRQMPHTIQISAYGCTECGGVVAFNDPDDTLEQRSTTSGRPFDGIELEIRDLEHSGPVDPGRRGEIVVRGYCLFEGYYKDERHTAAVLDDDGWFHTGDIGALSADGRISYLGRLKDMLKVGGENVAAVEIESYLGTHPAVSIAAVVGVPDPKYVEVAAAFIELAPGHAPTEAEIIDFCRGGLAAFKVPRYVRFVTDWPTSATKIQKFRLQEQLADELARERAQTSSGPAG